MNQGDNGQRSIRASRFNPRPLLLHSANWLFPTQAVCYKPPTETGTRFAGPIRLASSEQEENMTATNHSSASDMPENALPRLADLGDGRAPGPDFMPMRLVMDPGGLAVELKHPELIVGRHSEADLRLPLPEVSRRHCKLFCKA